MIDNYQYQPQALPPKNKELFGFGGRPSAGSNGLQSSIIENGISSSGGSQQGPPGPQGPQGPPGDSTISAPPSTGTYVLGSIDGVVQWINTTECV